MDCVLNLTKANIKIVWGCSFHLIFILQLCLVQHLHSLNLNQIDSLGIIVSAVCMFVCVRAFIYSYIHHS